VGGLGTAASASLPPKLVARAWGSPVLRHGAGGRRGRWPCPSPPSDPASAALQTHPTNVRASRAGAGSGSLRSAPGHRVAFQPGALPSVPRPGLGALPARAPGLPEGGGCGAGALRLRVYWQSLRRVIPAALAAVNSGTRTLPRRGAARSVAVWVMGGRAGAALRPSSLRPSPAADCADPSPAGRAGGRTEGFCQKAPI